MLLLMPVLSCVLNSLMAPEQAASVPSTASNVLMRWVRRAHANAAHDAPKDAHAPALTRGTAAHQPFACALIVSDSRVCCRRPGYRSTAEHILTLCKDKEYAVPFLAGQYQKSLIDHALHRLDSQVSMVSALLGALSWRLPSSIVALSDQADISLAEGEGQAAMVQYCGPGLQPHMMGSSFLGQLRLSRHHHI